MSHPVSLEKEASKSPPLQPPEEFLTHSLNLLPSQQINSTTEPNLTFSSNSGHIPLNQEARGFIRREDPLNSTTKLAGSKLFLHGPPIQSILPSFPGLRKVDSKGVNYKIQEIKELDDVEGPAEEYCYNTHFEGGIKREMTSSQTQAADQRPAGSKFLPLQRLLQESAHHDTQEINFNKDDDYVEEHCYNAADFEGTIRREKAPYQTRAAGQVKTTMTMTAQVPFEREKMDEELESATIVVVSYKHARALVKGIRGLNQDLYSNQLPIIHQLELFDKVNGEFWWRVNNINLPQQDWDQIYYFMLDVILNFSVDFDNDRRMAENEHMLRLFEVLNSPREKKLIYMKYIFYEYKYQKGNNRSSTKIGTWVVDQVRLGIIASLQCALCRGSITQADIDYLKNHRGAFDLWKSFNCDEVRWKISLHRRKEEDYAPWLLKILDNMKNLVTSLQIGPEKDYLELPDEQILSNNYNPLWARLNELMLDFLRKNINLVNWIKSFLFCEAKHTASSSTKRKYLYIKGAPSTGKTYFINNILLYRLLRMNLATSHFAKKKGFYELHAVIFDDPASLKDQPHNSLANKMPSETLLEFAHVDVTQNGDQSMQLPAKYGWLDIAKAQVVFISNQYPDEIVSQNTVRAFLTRVLLCDFDATSHDLRQQRNLSSHCTQCQNEQSNLYGDYLQAPHSQSPSFPSLDDNSSPLPPYDSILTESALASMRKGLGLIDEEGEEGDDPNDASRMSLSKRSKKIRKNPSGKENNEEQQQKNKKKKKNKKKTKAQEQEERKEQKNTVKELCPRHQKAHCSNPYLAMEDVPMAFPFLIEGAQDNASLKRMIQTYPSIPVVSHHLAYFIFWRNVFNLLAEQFAEEPADLALYCYSPSLRTIITSIFAETSHLPGKPSISTLGYALYTTLQKNITRQELKTMLNTTLCPVF